MKVSGRKWKELEGGGWEGGIREREGRNKEIL